LEKNQKYYKLKDEKFDLRGPYRIHPLEATKSVDVRPNLVYPIPAPDATEIWPVRQWWGDKKRTIKALNNTEVEFIKGKNGWTVQTKQYLRDENGVERRKKAFSIIDNIYTQHGTNEIAGLFGDSRVYTFPKPSNLLSQLLEIAQLHSDEIILDFFAGSGPIGQATLNYNRRNSSKCKYIMVEIADFFDGVMKARIQKVMFSSDWKDGKPTSKDGISHMFKYQYLEQYEDSLNNIEFMASGKVQKTLEELEGYFLKYMLDFETRDSPTRLNIDKFSRPFEYKLKITDRNETREEVVDLVETFNYLLGLHVKQIKTYKNNGTDYRVVFGEKDNDSIAVIWRATDELDLRADKAFIEGNILRDFEADKIFVNGNSYLENALPIEPDFKRRMGG
jgi:adenine-specific DNA-methyltransferase